MHLCIFCCYINGITTHRPFLQSYTDHDPDFFINLYPRGNELLDRGGGQLTDDYKIIPTIYSELYDKTLQIENPEIQKAFNFWVNKKVCDRCIQQLVLDKDCTIIHEISLEEKAFKLFLRKQK